MLHTFFSEDAQDATLGPKGGHREIQKARVAASNTLEFVVTSMLCDRACQKRKMILVAASRAAFHMDHENNVNNHSAKESLEWFKNRADHALPDINQVLDVTEERNMWGKLGGHESWSCPSQYLWMHEHHRAAPAQDDLATDFGRFRIALVLRVLSCQVCSLALWMTARATT